jgi:hypothetical protein
MRILSVVLGLVLLLTAGGPPAGSVGATSMRLQLAAIPVAAPVNPDPRVGPIFIEGDLLHICTGSVVHSSTGDLILTAAHRLAKGFKAEFVPGFANIAAPSNVWTVDAAYLDPLWIAFKDPRVDYAFAQVSRPGGGSIEAQVGSTVAGQSTRTGDRSRSHRLCGRHRGQADRLPKQHGDHQWLPVVFVRGPGCRHQRLAVDQGLDGHRGDRRPRPRRVHAHGVLLSAV